MEKKKIGKIGKISIYAEYRLPWDDAVLIARIAQAGTGTYGSDLGPTLVCTEGNWSAHVYCPIIGERYLDTTIAEIWRGIQDNWDTACKDCDSRTSTLRIDHMAHQAWAYPDTVEEREELWDPLEDLGKF